MSAVPPSLPTVPARAARPRRVALAGALVAMLALGACTGRVSIPDKYGDTTQKNFLRACQAPEDEDFGDGKAIGVQNSAKVCACIYNGIVKQIPFKDFKKINSDLSDKPAAVPKVMQDIIDTCNESGGPWSGPVGLTGPAAARGGSGRASVSRRNASGGWGRSRRGVGLRSGGRRIRRRAGVPGHG